VAAGGGATTFTGGCADVFATVTAVASRADSAAVSRLCFFAQYATPISPATMMAMMMRLRSMRA